MVMTTITTDDPLALRIVDAVSRLMRHSARTWDDLEPRIGISEAQANVLAAVQGGAQQVSSVADACGRHVSTASRLVDQLVRSGHLERDEDPTDRRAVLLELTDVGREALTTVSAAHGGFLSQALDRLAPETADALADALERLADAADTVGEGPGDGHGDDEAAGAP